VTHAQMDGKPAHGGKYWPWPSRRDDAITATTSSTKECNFLQRRAAFSVNHRKVI
jgi:hypothetical protein